MGSRSILDKNREISLILFDDLGTFGNIGSMYQSCSYVNPCQFTSDRLKHKVISIYFNVVYILLLLKYKISILNFLLFVELLQNNYHICKKFTFQILIFSKNMSTYQSIGIYLLFPISEIHQPSWTGNARQYHHQIPSPFLAQFKRILASNKFEKKTFYACNYKSSFISNLAWLGGGT